MADVDEVYQKVQVVQAPDRRADREELESYSHAWKDPSLPQLQAEVADHQLDRLRRGEVDPVFAALIRVLESIPDESPTLLDAACAGGYYSEVVAVAKPGVEYVGSDYSEAMIAEARRRYPGGRFLVEDARKLTFENRSFDCVMLSGALEHIPNHDAAIAELCRVARRYVVLHRLPVVLGKQPQYNIGTQYSIETPRIYFPRRVILKRFRDRGFTLEREVPVYAHGLKHEIRRRLHPSRPDTRTFLFSRAAE